MEIVFLIFLALIVNTVFASHASEWTNNIYLRRLMILPPFGFLALIVVSIIALSFLAIQTFKEIWNRQDVNNF